MTDLSLLSLFRAAARLWPWPLATDPDIDRALDFLDAEIDSDVLARAGNGAGLLVGLSGLPALALAPALDRLRVPAVAVIFALAVGVVYAIRRGPIWLATARRTAALGAAPALVARAVLRMRVEPASERAAAFAAESRGPLADSLADHVRRTAGTPDSGLAAFGATWGDWNPPLRRAVLLVEAAAEAPPGERGRTLDRAMDAILVGTRDRMAAFAERVRGPTTALYAFGVLLPLALVAVLPAARIAGFPLSVPALVVVYDLLLPALLVCAGAWLLVRRPAAFPPPEVSRSHPEVSDRRWFAVGSGVAVALLALVGTAPLPGWTRWISVSGGSLGATLVVWFRPVKLVRDDARAVEAHLTDALYLVGRRVSDGAPVEAAIADAAPEVASRTGEMLTEAAGVQRRLRVGVRESFLGDHGALAEVPSPQARSVAALLAIAAREGRPAGRAVVSMADHLDDLRRVEREARRELASVTGTLRNTAGIFGPLVGGATVALADGMATGALGEPFPTAALGLAVGGYVLLLAAILAALATGLERGFDRALVGYRVGLALLSAVGSFLAGFVGAGFAA